MKRIYKLLLVVFVNITFLTGCGDDRLVMTTTENTRTTTEKQTNAEDTTEELVTEAASDEDKALTLSMLYEANKGDVLLQNSAGVKVQLDFYGNGNKQRYESYFIGFDSEGNYVQSYEDSEGVCNVFDHRRGCWYVSDNENGIHTKIYPENDIADRLVDYYHNEMVYTPSDEGTTEEITDIYRLNGRLILEVQVSGEDGDYQYKYVLDDEYKILSYECWNGNNLVMTETTSLNTAFSFPPALAELKDRTDERIITVKNTDSGIECSYLVSSRYPVSFETYGAGVYLDEACNTHYENIANDIELRDENGTYQDLTLYLKQ